VRVLIVSQMWPSPHDPDLGAFVAQMAGELERRGHRVERATIDRRGGSKLKYARLGWAALGSAVRHRPDVIYAHFLVPAGALAAVVSLIARVPLVVTAHGTDVRNVRRIRGVRALTRATLGRADKVVAVSDFLRRELTASLPLGARKIEVIDCGVDLERFRGRDPEEAREKLGLDGEGPFFLFVGTLDRRKNVLALVDAFERLGAGQLIVIGDGPLRARIEGRAGVRLVGRVAHGRIPEWIAACDVLCQPSLEEPFGQAVLEAMACERPVVATSIGGPREFVTPESGVLVDPRSVESIRAGLERAAALPSPNAAGRRAATRHDVRVQGERVAELLRGASASRG
jgi:glycosyltransferase involved in cell wall biosynthesis